MTLIARWDWNIDRSHGTRRPRPPAQQHRHWYCDYDCDYGYDPNQPELRVAAATVLTADSQTPADPKTDRTPLVQRVVPGGLVKDSTVAFHGTTASNATKGPKGAPTGQRPTRHMGTGFSSILTLRLLCACELSKYYWSTKMARNISPVMVWRFVDAALSHLFFLTVSNQPWWVHSTPPNHGDELGNLHSNCAVATSAPFST